MGQGETRMTGLGERAPSRRVVLGSMAAMGASALLPGASALAQGAEKTRRIDTHSHYFAPEWKEADAAFAKKVGGPPPFTGGWTVEKSLEDMEKGGVTTAVLSLPSIPGNWFGGDPKVAVRLSRTSNEYAAGLVRDHAG